MLSISILQRTPRVRSSPVSYTHLTVADILNEKRIVILNLETCPNDASQRIIDFLYGVAYANHGVFKKVAGRAYIITPYSVPVTGELLDEISGGSSNE